MISRAVRVLSLLVPGFLLALGPPAFPQDVVKRVGTVTFVVDTSLGVPGGLLRVRLSSRGALGAAYAILDGRRAPFYLSGRGPRALVPVPLTSTPGPNTLGIEIIGRRGRQRIPINVTLGERSYPPRTVVIPEEKRALLQQPSVVRDGRLLLSFLRTENPQALGIGPLRAPVAPGPGAGFGGVQTWVGGSAVESRTDGIFGEQHRGLDYAVAAGSVVSAPAAGLVLYSGPLALSGDTLVIDHGQGVISALFHLSRIDVRAGDRVEAGAPVGLAGDTGLALAPGVEWRLYVHGIAADPRLFEKGFD